MLRLILVLLFAVCVARAFWRFVDGIAEGLRGTPRRSGMPDRGVSMARDPVCGTFVVPNDALSAIDGAGRVYFCSPACRDTYRVRVRGRTA
jgi:YHS domain-containing protein